MNRFDLGLARIKKYGWIKGKLGHKTYGFCLLGSMYMLEGEENYGIKAQQEKLLLGVIKEQYPIIYDNFLSPTVDKFNDHDDIGQEDVEMVLEKAAVKWDEIA